MAKKFTRRQFLKLTGQAVLVGGAACTVTALDIPVAAAGTPAGDVPLDGREMVCRVGDTFATIQLMPRYTKTSEPVTVYAKAQYGTDPTFATYLETAEVPTEYYSRSERGKHTGTQGTKLVASRKTHFLSGHWEIAANDLIYNESDDSVMTVTRVADDRTIEGPLSGGTKNLWSKGDRWRLDRTYYRIEINLTGLQPNTKYYYRVLLRFGGDSWGTPRTAHSFRTRRPAGQSFRFGVWADTHRDIREKALSKQLWHWPEWSTLVASLKNEQVDFLIDVGDSWLMCQGSGKPTTKDFPEAYARIRPSRSGYLSYRGYSDMCADCGYYLVRGNHDGLTDADPTSWKQLFTPLLKLFVPNPNGHTYPQGGSTDIDYDQGYFAFEWGDALVIILDCVKYKEPRKKNATPARFHIGAKQLAWLTTVLQNATQRWKFIFSHHLFGGGDNYGRGGAAFAHEYEQAQIHALCQQHEAHFFHGHDHLLAPETADGVLYYEVGLAWGSQSDYRTKGTGTGYEKFYPNGFTPTSCHSEPPSCENNGYMVVEVTPTQATIQYKNYLGGLVHTTVLT